MKCVSIFRFLGLATIMGLGSVGVQAWKTKDGVIYDKSNQVYNLSGISWFGFETQDFVTNGLWTHPMSFYMDVMKDNGFNTIRVPFSAEWILYNFNLYPDGSMVSADPQNQHKKSIEILDTLFDMAEERQMHIMLDLHRLHKEYISELWYSPTDNMFSAGDFINTWFVILDRYHDRSSLIAIDLLNEPHGRATWGTGDTSTDWNSFAEYAISQIVARYTTDHWLMLVEGIGWGKDLSQARYHPLQFESTAIAQRVVYSAHTYGRSVVSSTDIYNIPQLYQDWTNSFGFLVDDGHTFFIGEYGGITDLDGPWMQTLVQYLISKKQRNHFFWSLGPNSGDVHGFLLDDWTTIDSFKQQITKSLQPYPTF
jgi:aryl-phospho-beta-D-glucosidase BglC (GH1 family)